MAQTFDISIRGDGIVGRTLALLLARQNLQVGLVNQATSSKPDVRTYSLNSASRDVLSSLRCWPDPLNATPVMDMQVWGDGGGSVQFESPTPDGLTWIVDVPVLEAQLGDALNYQHNITLIDAPHAAQLTVICEGRNSHTRQDLQVETEVLPYQQTAVATRIRSSTPHGQKAPVVAICAKLEAEMSEMGDEDRQMFLEELGQTEPGLNRLIRSAYSLLGLQTYFTAGVKEVRAWTIHVGDTGPQAAGVIHTDFEKGYIRAQTIAFDDFIALKGEQGAKDAGKMRAEGKEYVVKDGDVMNFLFSS